MAEPQQQIKKKKENADQKDRTRQNDSKLTTETSYSWENGIPSLSETPFLPRIEEHIGLLSNITFNKNLSDVVLHLQQTYGNQYVQRLAKLINIQAELTVNRQDDIYEKEAERVARPSAEEEELQEKAIRVQPQTNEGEEVQRNNEKTPLCYYVSGVPAIAQPSDKTCWAAVGSMMIGWKIGFKCTIEEALGTLGDNAEVYINLFRLNADIAYADKGRYLDAIGLIGEEPTNYTPEGLQGQLQAHGPIWVTTKPISNLHARILTGIEGDGTVDGTMLEIINPEGAGIEYETVRQFSEKYEAAKGELVKVQMAYF